MKRLLFTLCCAGLLSCAGFVQNLPPVQDDIGCNQCRIGAINVTYTPPPNMTIQDDMRRRIVGFNSELIKDRLVRNGLYCNDASGAILDIDLKEEAYIRFMGIKTTQMFWPFFSGLSLFILPSSTHTTFVIHARLRNSRQAFATQGTEFQVFAVPMIFFAFTNDIQKQHNKLMETLVDDLCQQIIKNSPQPIAQK